MQSALSGHLPLVTRDGEHIYRTCEDSPGEPSCVDRAPVDAVLDADGAPVPVLAPQDSWEFVTSHGWHIAEAAEDALAAGEALTPTLRVGAEDFWLPVHNTAYQQLGPTGLFDIDLDRAVDDRERCPAVDDGAMGCLAARVFRAEIGELGLLTAPGEVLPELAWGFPASDPAWDAEETENASRGEGATYFPQHDADCDDVPYEDCVAALAIGACDCLAVHAVPYRLSDDPEVRPLLDYSQTRYRAMLSMTDAYYSYMIPSPDVNRRVDLFIGQFSGDGDHYEDTVTISWDFATVVQEAHARLDARWGAAD